ncbi:nucleotide-binding universal stress UspA family protein [Caulobacter ginsengisoli]|uniref:Nucleotide-binding universal stress UspA family protein n=1 Tax=Caulobacter ginsengisoli TaxID=400775 RepID=A0ABU0IXW5_9CAUL|nr:universal stress protein [Caulobacter ginsengisoli]MDQ0466853.1 nucleotide-binding universal stress UspA family protein [Caulobacter ginsengisoli]
MTPPFGDILHATDLHPDGDGAFRAALAIALSGRGSLSIVHAEPHRDRAGHQWTGFPQVRETLAAWGRLPRNAPATAVSETLGLQVSKVDLGGRDLVRGIGRFLDERPCDLVVMATHGDHCPTGWPRPSQSQAVAAVARAPSLFIPINGAGLADPLTGDIRLRQVLVPVDSRPRADAALAAAVDLAQQLGCGEAVFHLLHVGPGWPVVTLPPSLTEGPTGRVRKMLAEGPAAAAILQAADETAADLIVMATEGRHGILDALRGSVTQQVIGAARRPVLAVPAR